MSPCHRDSVSLCALEVNLPTGAPVNKRWHNETSEEVENETKRDGDGQSWQRLPEYGQQEQRETQTLHHTQHNYVTIRTPM